MSQLISIWDLEWLPTKKFNKKSLYIIEALNRLKNKNKFKKEKYEDTIDVAEFILEIHKVSEHFENYRGNKNGLI